MRKDNENWNKEQKPTFIQSPIALFAQDARTIADSLASREMSPQGPASGMRILTFYINRAGRGMSASRRRNLEKAKKLLLERVEQERRDSAHRNR